MDETPKTSSRNMARQSGTILNVLKSYIPTLCQGLHEDDYDRRLEFAQTFLTVVEDNPEYTKIDIMV